MINVSADKTPDGCMYLFEPYVDQEMSQCLRYNKSN